LYTYVASFFPMFYLFFQTYVTSMLIWILRMFTMVSSVLCVLQVLQTHVSSVSSVLRHVGSVASGFFESRSGVASSSSPSVVSPRCLLRLQRRQRGLARPSGSSPFQVLKLGVWQRWRSRGQCWHADGDSLRMWIGHIG
jgi:hypothetical protein